MELSCLGALGCSCLGAEPEQDPRAAAGFVWSILEHRIPKSLQNPSRVIDSILCPIPTCSPAQNSECHISTPGWAPQTSCQGLTALSATKPFGMAELMVPSFLSVFLCSVIPQRVCRGCQ